MDSLLLVTNVNFSKCSMFTQTLWIGVRLSTHGISALQSRDVLLLFRPHSIPRSKNWAFVRRGAHRTLLKIATDLNFHGKCCKKMSVGKLCISDVVRWVLWVIFFAGAI